MKGENMSYRREDKSTYFNFRLRPKDMDQLRRVVKQFQYFSMASFIRAAIKEKIHRELSESTDAN